jgi:hypothetical protein
MAVLRRCGFGDFNSSHQPLHVTTAGSGGDDAVLAAAAAASAAASLLTAAVCTEATEQGAVSRGILSLLAEDADAEVATVAPRAESVCGGGSGGAEVCMRDLLGAIAAGGRSIRQDQLEYFQDFQRGRATAPR